MAAAIATICDAAAPSFLMMGAGAYRHNWRMIPHRYFWRMPPGRHTSLLTMQAAAIAIFGVARGHRHFQRSDHLAISSDTHVLIVTYGDNPGAIAISAVAVTTQLFKRIHQCVSL